MARHQVPQFIEIEDKIFGPLTFKQFVYILGSAGFAFIVFRLVPFLSLAILLAAPGVVLGLALAFYKVNNKPFISTLESAVRYFLGAKLYIWKKEPKKTIKAVSSTDNYEKLSFPKLSESKLEDLSWGLDIKEKVEEE